MPLIEKLLQPLAERGLIQLALTSVASAADTPIHKKMFGSGRTTLIISNEEMDNIMKIVKSLEESRLLIKGVSKAIKNQAKKLKIGFLIMLSSTLCVGYNQSWPGFLMPSYPLNNFEVQNLMMFIQEIIYLK